MSKRRINMQNYFKYTDQIKSFPTSYPLKIVRDISYQSIFKILFCILSF